MRKWILMTIICGWAAIAQAQVFDVVPEDSTATSKASGNVVVADGFWRHWFVQAGLDMSLQNPYGYDFSKVFPNGKTFGLDVAAGKWFTHQVGYRVKVNWENALPLLENGHVTWLAPFDKPGENREKGGYIGLYGDILLNMHNLFGKYRADRTWNLSVYPRIGVNYNFGVKKGSLLAGAGILNTYRLNNRWSLYADVAYILTGSGFVGINESGGTGTGSNSNGYFSIGLGAQVELGKVGSEELSTQEPVGDGVLANGIWDNWFVQAGMDMSLMNPYGSNFFGNVIPKGMVFGLNGAVGKWFSPEFALRARVQWDNGLIPNNGVEWVAPKDDPKQNYKKGGMAAVSIDAMLNMTNVVAGYLPERRWHTTVYMRAGLFTQFAESSASPLMGVGVQETYRLNNRLSLFGSMGYQVTTSEGMGYIGTTGMSVSSGSNGFFDIDFGVVYDLGRKRTGFRRDRSCVVAE